MSEDDNVKKTRNKEKRGELFGDFTRISFGIKSTAERQHITLESEYIAALEKIAPDNRNQWLSETVDTYIEAHGVESTTRIVKLAIVSKLMTENQTKKPQELQFNMDEKVYAILNEIEPAIKAAIIKALQS